MNTNFYTTPKGEIPISQESQFGKVEYMIIDVDGTLTDGGIYYDDHGNELKKFNARDAAGFFTAKICGIKTMVLTGRNCEATNRRMKEMKVDIVEQGIVDKLTFMKQFIADKKLSREQLAYVGDDLNDYNCMLLCGFVGCPDNAADEVKNIAHYVSPKHGGDAAFRDIVTYLLKERGQWKEAIHQSYGVSLSEEL